MKIPVLVTGSNGLVASAFHEAHGSKYEIEPVDISNPDNPVDITDRNAVARTLGNSEAKHIIHFAAYTDVNGAWEQRNNKDGIAYRVNVGGTENIAKEAKKNGQHLIHISTAYVFDGSKEGLYTEADQQNPIEWYGYTKAEAENVISGIDGLSYTILRIDQPFKPKPFAKADIAHRIIHGLRDGSLYPQFTNHYFGPTYLPDFANVLDSVIEQQAFGLFNASSGEKWTDYDFAVAIREAHGFETPVKSGDLDVYLETLNRPYQRNTALDTSKLKTAIGLELTPIKEAIRSIEY